MCGCQLRGGPSRAQTAGARAPSDAPSSPQAGRLGAEAVLAGEEHMDTGDLTGDGPASLGGSIRQALWERSRLLRSRLASYKPQNISPEPAPVQAPEANCDRLDVAGRVQALLSLSLPLRWLSEKRCGEDRRASPLPSPSSSIVFVSRPDSALLRYNSHNRIHRLKGCNLVLFSILTMLCNHYH